MTLCSHFSYSYAYELLAIDRASHVFIHLHRRVANSGQPWAPCSRLPLQTYTSKSERVRSMASHDSRRRRRELAVLAFVASMIWLLASQSICDGRVLNYSIDPSLWFVLLQKRPSSAGESGCNAQGGSKKCDPPLGVSPVRVAVSTPP
ncbi:unnamed protein product [Musa acuminata subsp. burmannicoides]|uniref:(wild Malaysian banana) hypothetical protein n=1 Tax=Musa acuminata subsp. malaccensis TaxID=214687 RepID=A0A804IV49_MUSAM|nr:unnamed protein product [Musa acuminata subsp. malaccensis]